MSNTEFLLDYWYFHLPNYVLAALVYTLLGRFLLGLFVPPDWDNYIWRFFRRLTDPVLRGVAVVTPSAIPAPILPLVGAYWLFLARVIFWFALFYYGVAPTVSPG